MSSSIDPLPSPICPHPSAIPFDAVLFDFDGIIVDTEWAIYQAWKRTFLTHGHDLPLDIYTRCIGSDFDTWSPKTHLESLTGRSFDWHQLDADRQIEIRHELRDAQPMPGVRDALTQLHATNTSCAVVSSSNHGWVDGWLDRLNLSHHFTAIVCRGDAPQIKPAPDLWHEAIRQLDIKPSRGLAIEDSINGVTSAKDAGLTVWAIPNRTTAALDFSSVADRVYPSLEQSPLGKTPG